MPLSLNLFEKINPFPETTENFIFFNAYNL